MIEAVRDIVVDVANTEILPRRPSAVSSDSPSFPTREGPEVVTEADLHAEGAIASRLVALLDLPVVAEEAAKLDASLRALPARRESYWLVDPIDGTANFAAGRDEFGVMVCLVRDGDPVVAAIHLPVLGRTLLAERGAGAYANGVRLATRRAVGSTLDGAIYAGFFDPQTRAELERIEVALNGATPRKHYTAALDYGDLARGEKDFLVYGRLRPWDHAPGGLIATEAGGVARLATDRRAYAPDVDFGPLIVAANTETFERVRERVAPVTRSD